MLVKSIWINEFNSENCFQNVFLKLNEDKKKLQKSEILVIFEIGHLFAFCSVNYQNVWKQFLHLSSVIPGARSHISWLKI